LPVTTSQMESLSSEAEVGGFAKKPERSARAAGDIRVEHSEGKGSDKNGIGRGVVRTLWEGLTAREMREGEGKG
jgi:hypothetical protein